MLLLLYVTYGPDSLPLSLPIIGSSLASKATLEIKDDITTEYTNELDVLEPLAAYRATTVSRIFL